MAVYDDDLIDLRSDASTNSSVVDIVIQNTLLDAQDPIGHANQPWNRFNQSGFPNAKLDLINKFMGVTHSNKPPNVLSHSLHTPDGGSRPVTTSNGVTSPLPTVDSVLQPEKPAAKSHPRALKPRKYAWDEIICIGHTNKPIQPAKKRMFKLGLHSPGERIPRTIAKPAPGSTTALVYRTEVPHNAHTHEYTSAAQIAQAVKDFRDDLRYATTGARPTSITHNQAWDLVLNKRCAEHQGGSVMPASAGPAASAAPAASAPAAPGVAEAPKSPSSPPAPPQGAISKAAAEASNPLARFLPAHYFEDSPPTSPVVNGAGAAAGGPVDVDDWWSTPR